MTRHTQPTLADVAARAGVSSATVSRTLNFPDQVQRQTRERVQAAVRALGYSPHFGARYLASNRTNTVGAVIPTMDNAIFAAALQALQEVLSENGITLLVATSNYDAAREAAQIETLMSRGVDGMVLIGEARAAEIYDRLHARRMPYVLMWTYRPDSAHACVGFDNFRAAQAIAEKVLALGHVTIAMLAGRTIGNDRATERVHGVRAALARHDLALDPPYYLETEYNFDDSARATRQLLALPCRPTALICGNDVIAAGAIQQARAMWLDIPDELSVVGFDDIDLAAVVSPPLTTVHVPHRRMGIASAQLLIRMIRDEAPIDRIEFEAGIVERASLAAVPLPAA